MIYEWKCRLCGLILEVNRSVSEFNKPPHDSEWIKKDCEHGWDRYFNFNSLPRVPFEHLKQSGVFADDNGNFAPRNT